MSILALRFLLSQQSTESLGRRIRGVAFSGDYAFRDISDCSANIRHHLRA